LTATLDGPDGVNVSSIDPDTAAEFVSAVHVGDAEGVQRVVTASPDILVGALGGPFNTRWALHIVADWPGYFPNGPQIVRLLIGAGANPDGRDPGDETPLHWAASSDDADVAAALLDGGANIETPDGSIGTPLDNAIGYSCWHVAALLAARGARVEKLWHAAALGLLDRQQHLLDTGDFGQAEISQAFWHACAAGQRRAAEQLRARGAELNWTPDYAEGTALDAAKGRGTRRDNVISWLEEQGATGAIPQ
jgi:hypothetical protein